VKLSAPVIVTGVMAEETGGAGTIALIDQGVRPAMAVVAEWTSAQTIALGYRGRIELLVETRGRTAHGSRPHQGVNAVEHMAEVVLPAIKKYVRELPFTPRSEFMINGPSVAVTMIQGGVKVNVIPDLCKAQLDIRLAPGQEPDKVAAGLEDLAVALREGVSDLKVSLETGVKKFPFVTPPETFLVRELSACIREVLGREVTLVGKTGCSDGNIIAERLGIPVIAYGPGNATGHAPNEFIEINDYLDSIRVLTAAVPRLVGKGPERRS
jgi:acetylornithine deacetylase/succinyl-diaminopimelate desuccinylase-like protein